MYKQASYSKPIRSLQDALDRCQNLEALSSQSIIECIEHGDGRLYGNNSDSHSHVNCIDTNQILDVHIELPEDLLRQVEAQTGIKIAEYSINFYGYRHKPSD